MILQTLTVFASQDYFVEIIFLTNGQSMRPATLAAIPVFLPFLIKYYFTINSILTITRQQKWTSCQSKKKSNKKCAEHASENSKLLWNMFDNFRGLKKCFKKGTTTESKEPFRGKLQSIYLKNVWLKISGERRKAKITHCDFFENVIF